MATFNDDTFTYTIDGEEVDALAAKGASDAIARDAQARLSTLASRLENGTITLQEGYTEAKRAVKDLHIAEYALSRGGFDQVRDWSRAEAIIAEQWSGNEQFNGLRTFFEEIEAGRYGIDSLGNPRYGGGPSFQSRLLTYGDAGRLTYENERLAARMEAGELLEARAITGASDHCEECVERAALGWIEAHRMFNDYPVGRSRCSVHCISTPWSRVTTQRGLVPICEIKIGDMVLTHEHRWQPVVSISRSHSKPTHSQAWVTSPNGEVIGCTSDHEFFTSKGWQPIGELKNDSLLMYTLRRENLRQMRQISSPRLPELNLQKLSFNMCLRSEKGLSRNRVQEMWNGDFGEKTVGGFVSAGSHSGGYSGVTEKRPHSLRRFDLGKISQGQKRGRQTLRAILGRGWQSPHYLPLPMAVAKCERSLLIRVGFASYQRRLHGRQIGKSGIGYPVRAFSDTHDFRQDGNDGRGSGKGFEWKNNIPVPNLWPDISKLFPQWVAPNVLLEEMPVGTPLWDIGVANDHSFFLEGVAVHNCYCVIVTRKAAVDEANAIGWNALPAAVGKVARVAAPVAVGFLGLFQVARANPALMRALLGLLLQALGGVKV